MDEPTADRPVLAGYGITGDLDGLLPWSWAVERLTRTRNYWLGTTTPAGAPHTMPVWGVWSSDRLIVSTGRQSRKYRNLAHDPRCVVSTGDGEEAAIVEGIAREVGTTAQAGQIQGFVAAYRAKYDIDITSMDEPLFEIRPSVVFGFIEHGDQFTTTATRWRFADS